MSIEKGNIEADWKKKYEIDDLQKPWINYLGPRRWFFDAWDPISQYQSSKSAILFSMFAMISDIQEMKQEKESFD